MFLLGEVAEWSIAAVLKTVDPKGSGGSNPSLSANARNEFSGNHQAGHEDIKAIARGKAE